MTTQIEFGRGVPNWDGTTLVKLKYISDPGDNPDYEGFSLSGHGADGIQEIFGTMEDARRLAAALGAMVDAWHLDRRRRTLRRLVGDAKVNRDEVEEIYRTLGIPR